MNQNYKIVIIWAGATGMMCVATLIEKWFSGQVLLLDKNKQLWQKVSITGGGRCNVTSWIRWTKKILSKYIHGGDFLKSAMRQFPPSQVFKRFENHGVPLKIEKDMRVFPISNKSADIISVFRNIFQESSNISIQFDNKVLSVKKIDSKFHIKTNSQIITADKLVIATWWKAFEHTWSSWDGYTFAKSLWHKITKLGPSLSSLTSVEKWPAKISWLSLSDAKIFFELNNKTQNFSGDLLFTHRWISGPLAFVLSAYFAHQNLTKNSPQKVRIQIRNDMDFESRNNWLLLQLKDSQNKQIWNILRKNLPQNLIDILDQKMWNILDQKLCNFDKKNRKILCHLLSWSLELNIVGRKSGDEFVTAGWVELDQINPKTMESFVCPNLFFWWEILDIDGVTGGFNLQAAWCTGRMIWENIYL